VTQEVYKIVSHINFNYLGDKEERLQTNCLQITGDLQIQKEFFAQKCLKFVSGIIKKNNVLTPNKLNIFLEETISEKSILCEMFELRKNLDTEECTI